MSSEESGTENESITVRESATTVRERDAQTLRESGAQFQAASPRMSEFRGMPAERLPAAGAEADISILHTPEGKRVLKQYRYGIEMKPEVLEKIAEMSKSRPEHVVIIHESGFDAAAGCWYEIMEYAAYGSLARSFSSGRAKDFAFEDIVRELCEAIAALQDADMTHRDLKPSNILLRSEEPLDLILTDFGIASVMHGVSLRETARNFTPEYAPPEMEVASKAGDWWSLGIILYEALLGKTPFHGLDASAVYVSRATKPVGIPEELDPRQRLLLKGLLTRDIDRRWRADEVRRWLAGESPQAWYDTEAAPPAALAPEPLVFRKENYASLEHLAAAMAVSDEAWQHGARYLGKGYLAELLKRRAQYDDAALIDSLACEDGNEYVFRFIYALLKNPSPSQLSYRGLALTGENVFAALQAKDCAKGSVEEDFARRTLSDGWDSLLSYVKEKGIQAQQLFESIIAMRQTPHGHSRGQILNNHELVTQILACVLRPELFYWGRVALQGGQSKSYVLAGKTWECTISNVFLMAYLCEGKLLTRREWEEMGGDRIILPRSIATRLSDMATYVEGIRALKMRHGNKALLTVDTIKSGNFSDNVFQGTEEEYDECVKIDLRGYSAETMRLVKLAKSAAARGSSPTHEIFAKYLDYLEKSELPLAETDIGMCKELPGLLSPRAYFQHVSYWSEILRIVSIIAAFAALTSTFAIQNIAFETALFCYLVSVVSLPVSLASSAFVSYRKKSIADRIDSYLNHIDERLRTISVRSGGRQPAVADMHEYAVRWGKICWILLPACGMMVIFVLSQFAFALVCILAVCVLAGAFFGSGGAILALVAALWIGISIGDRTHFEVLRLLVVPGLLVAGLALFDYVLTRIGALRTGFIVAGLALVWYFHSLT